MLDSIPIRTATIIAWQNPAATARIQYLPALSLMDNSTIIRSLECLTESSKFSHQLHYHDYRNQVLARGLLQCQQGHHHRIVKKKWLKHAFPALYRSRAYPYNPQWNYDPTSRPGPSRASGSGGSGDLIVHTNKSQWLRLF